MAGKGAKILRDAGVTVVEDFMRDKCDELNPIFFHYITTKTPYVVMKYAMTLDGKIATKTGASKMDHPRSRTQRSTVYASSVYGDHGRDRNGTCG